MAETLSPENNISGMKRFMLRVHVWLLATFIPLLVRFVPLKRLAKLLTPPRAFRFYRGASAQLIAETVHRRLASPRNMKRRSCLREGLTLFHFLKLAGIPAVMHFCVYQQQENSPRMHAHCWVTVDDSAILTPPTLPHVMMFVHPPAGS